MNLKNLLKAFKLNESTISMVLGAVVIIIVGLLVVNYFRGVETGTTLPPIGSEETTLPTTHKVSEGEDLWKISEKYYGTGYNWVDIANANDISNPNSIETGQDLIIPDVEPKLAERQTPEPTRAQEKEIKEKPAQDLSYREESEPTNEVQLSEEEQPSPITGEAYTVVRGDNLWNIAVRAYGDGFRWKEIANANKLVNPRVIHSGNVFVIPR